MTDFQSGLYLGFDYGTKYIGIATGHSQTLTVSPLTVIKNNSGTPDWPSLEKLVNEWVPVGFIVGIPVHMDSTEQALTGQARGFKKRLAREYNIPAYEVDERLTTRQASEIVRKNRKSGKRKKTSKAGLDKIAAAIILQNWFESIDEFN